MIFVISLRLIMARHRAVLIHYILYMIILILVIISVMVEQCDRNNQVSYVRPYKVTRGIVEHNVHAHSQPEPLI